MTRPEAAFKRTDLIAGLVRGIAVLRAFNRDTPQHTASSLASTLGMSRAAARRFLITLEYLGLAATDGSAYWLTPRVLSLAHAYQSSEQLVRTVQPHLDALMHVTGETVSFGVIDGNEILYLARAVGPRILNTTIGPGSRLPLQCAAAGWAIMAHWPKERFQAWLKRTKLRKYTAQSVTNKKIFEKRVAAIRRKGFVLLEDQFEVGMRGIGAAVLSSTGEVVGGLTIVMGSNACSIEEAEARYGEPLKAAAQRLAHYL